MFTAALLGLLLPLAASGAPPAAVKVDGKSAVSLKEFAKYYDFKLTFDGKTAKIDGKYHHFVFTPDKKYASFNGVVINLSHPPFIAGNRIYLDAVDYTTVVLPLVSKFALKPHQLSTIVLDAGHGGRDSGAEGRRYQEKKLTLRITAKLYAKLKAAGYNVKLTRNRDVAVELSSRARAANAAGADLFVSIHINANPRSQVNGIESYCMTPAGAASSNAGNGKADFRNFPGNRNNPNNFALAYLCHRHMLKQTGAVDRGVKHARFAVLKEINCPAVLLECGFISNPAEESKLGSEEYIEKLAQGIADGIISYHKALLR